MSIDLEHFTPLRSAAGGVLIGIASAILLWSHGRVAGISGVAAGIFRPRSPDAIWRALFFCGLLGGGFVIHAFAPTAIVSDATVPLTQVALGGLCVGLGTRLGYGCTSGHGVCGNAALAPRSMVATATFMAVGMLTVWILRHAGGSV